MRKHLRKVRDWIARWFMRLLEAGRIFRMPLLFITALSTMTTALKGTQFENYTTIIAIILVGGGFLFAWLYDILKVMNLKNRSMQDEAQNFAGASMAIHMKAKQAQFEALGKYLKTDMSEEEYEELLEEKTNETLKEYRNGIDWEKMEGR